MLKKTQKNQTNKKNTLHPTIHREPMDHENLY